MEKLPGSLSSCFASTLPQAPAQPGVRRPFGVISVNTLHNHQFPPPARSLAAPTPAVAKPPPQLSWTLLRQLVISLSEEAAARFRNYPSEKLEYYRFPFPELPVDARGRLSKLLAQRTEGAELGRSCFQKIVESWRRALLSLYQSLRIGRTEYFYHLQSDLVVLFRRDAKGELLAHVTKASKALIKLLKEEGIPFSQTCSSDRDGGPHHGDDDDGDDEGAFKESSTSLPPPLATSTHPSSSLPDEFEWGDRENERPMDAKTVKNLVHDRLSRARKTQSRRRSAAAVTLTVRGEIGVHTLVDFILNQKDGRSFVILPELMAPGPFLYGTMCRSELSVVGPIVGGDHQIRLGGGGSILLPTLCKSILEQALVSSNEETVSLKPTIDDRTDAFLPFPCM